MRIAVIAVSLALAGGAVRASDEGGFTRGRPEIRSLSALAFAPDGTLFVGDARGGAVFAVDLGPRPPRQAGEAVELKDVEGQVAALLGTRAEDVMFHDLAVDPVSREILLAVSRGRGGWDSPWLLPNDVADAELLLRVDPAGRIEEVPLDDVRYARAALPDPVDPAKQHRWKEGISQRTDAITDMAYREGTLYVAGLSNEEFASALWRIPYPFSGAATTTTLEIFHGAHGEFETHAPIRSFVPYDLGGEPQLLAAYLCTPLVTFPIAGLADGAHVKGRTVGEFGSGSYPLDMILYRKDGEDRLLIANSNLPPMIVRTADIAAFEGSITERPPGYTAGVRFESRSGTGIQQLDLLDEANAIALQRQPGGSLDLVTLPLRRF